MDPITAIGVASAIIQFVKLGVEVSKKLAEYSAQSPGDIPKPLRSINTRLPLLVNALSRIQTEAGLSGFDEDTRSILNGVVLGCLKLVRELDDLATKVAPKPGESFGSKLKKVLGHMKLDDRVEDIDLGLQGYISVLILHRLVDRTAAHAVTTEELQYFEVKEKKVADPIARDAFISQLDKLFFEAARGQKDVPEYVILLGDEGVGKSQIALTYCYQAHEAGQFQTVFWLNASTPASLQLSLQSVSAAIRRSKTGTSEEKLKFLDNFLTERWHPWLLILDDYQHKEFHNVSLTQLVPQKGNGAILITTRDYDMPPLGQVVNVHKYLTAKEEEQLRYEATLTLWRKELDKFKTILDKGLNINSVSQDSWGRDGEPLANIAAEAGFDPALQLLLDRGANPSMDKAMSNVLSSALRGKSSSTIALYLDYEDKTDTSLEEQDYEHAFRVAIMSGDVANFKLLLARRGHYFKPEDWRTADSVISAAESGDLDILRALVSLNMFTISDMKKADVVAKAIGKTNIEMTKFLLNEAKVDPNNTDHCGESLLYHAAQIGYRSTEKAPIRNEFIQLLLDKGANPNLQNVHNKSTALHYSSAYGLEPAIKLLLANGANPMLKNEDGRTTLSMAINWKTKVSYPLLINADIPEDLRHDYYNGPFFAAAETGDRELALLLIEKGVLNNINKEGDTPLLLAIRKGHTATARLLIRHKASQATADKSGKVALLLAAEKGLDLVVKDLAKAADSPGLEVTDPKGFTPLILASMGGHEKTVKVLLGLGADRDAMNQFGETALDVAEERDFEELIKLLEGV